LRQDQERARQRREAEAAAALAEKQAAEEAAAAEEYAAKLQQWKEWRARSIAPEPTLDVKETVRIGLRFPDTAERVTRKFRADTDIEELYAFVECYETLQETLPATGASKPENFKHIYGFRLVSPMPRTVYDLELGGTIGERVGRSGNLIVEPIVEEEDDGDDED